MRSGQGCDSALLCEPDDGCRALLQAYPQPAVLREAAEIIRSWADEDPRALWERLRAEGPIRGAGGGEVARWTYLTSTSYDTATIGAGFVHPETGGRYGASRADQARRLAALAAYEIARWARITTSNRLINLDPQTWRNTGQGGTTHGGEDFSTGQALLEADRASFSSIASRTQGPKSRGPNDSSADSCLGVSRTERGLPSASPGGSLRLPIEQLSRHAVVLAPADQSAQGVEDLAVLDDDGAEVAPALEDRVATLAAVALQGRLAAVAEGDHHAGLLSCHTSLAPSPQGQGLFLYDAKKTSCDCGLALIYGHCFACDDPRDPTATGGCQAQSATEMRSGHPHGSGPPAGLVGGPSPLPAPLNAVVVQAVRRSVAQAQDGGPTRENG